MDKEINPMEKIRLASAVLHYWNSKFESVRVGRIKFAKKTKLMNFENDSIDISERIKELKRLAAYEHALNFLHIEAKNINTEIYTLSYRDGVIRQYHRKNNSHMYWTALVDICGVHWNVLQDHFAQSGTHFSLFSADNEQNSIEDFQAYLRKVNNFAAFCHKISNYIQNHSKSAFNYETRVKSPSVVPSVLPTVEDILNAELHVYLYGFRPTFSNNFVPPKEPTFIIPGTVPIKVSKARDLSKIVPRRMP